MIDENEVAAMRPPTVIEPTVGRVVWYRPGVTDTDSMVIGDNSQPFCALVAFVHGPRMVNLVVFDHNGDRFSRTSVTLVQEGDNVPIGRYAEWMPYQIGQAKRHAAA